MCLNYSRCQFYKYSYYFLKDIATFQFVPPGPQVANSRNHSIWNVRKKLKRICAAIYLETLLFRSFIAEFSKLEHILVVQIRDRLHKLKGGYISERNNGNPWRIST